MKGRRDRILDFREDNELKVILSTKLGQARLDGAFCGYTAQDKHEYLIKMFHSLIKHRDLVQASKLLFFDCEQTSHGLKNYFIAR